jgi:hypothetical protein
MSQSALTRYGEMMLQTPDLVFLHPDQRRIVPLRFTLHRVWDMLGIKAGGEGGATGAVYGVRDITMPATP